MTQVAGVLLRIFVFLALVFAILFVLMLIWTMVILMFQSLS